MRKLEGLRGLQVLIEAQNTQGLQRNCGTTLATLSKLECLFCVNLGKFPNLSVPCFLIHNMKMI